MESIGEITVDSSGSLAIPKEICEQVVSVDYEY